MHLPPGGQKCCFSGSGGHVCLLLHAADSQCQQLCKITGCLPCLHIPLLSMLAADGIHRPNQALCMLQGGPRPESKYHHLQFTVISALHSLLLHLSQSSHQHKMSLHQFKAEDCMVASETAMQTLREASSGITACSCCRISETFQPVSKSPSTTTVILSRSLSRAPVSKAVSQPQTVSSDKPASMFRAAQPCKGCCTLQSCQELARRMERNGGADTWKALQQGDPREVAEALTDAHGCLNRFCPGGWLHSLVPCCVQGRHQQIAGARGLHEQP